MSKTTCIRAIRQGIVRFLILFTAILPSSGAHASDEAGSLSKRAPIPFDPYWGWNYTDGHIPLEKAPEDLVRICSRVGDVFPNAPDDRANEKVFNGKGPVYLAAKAVRGDTIYIMMDQLEDRSKPLTYNENYDRDFSVWKIAGTKCTLFDRGRSLFEKENRFHVPEDLREELGYDFTARYIKGFGSKARLEYSIRHYMRLMSDYSVLRPILDQWPDDPPKTSTKH